MNSIVVRNGYPTPALIAAAGERAGDPLSRILRRQHPQPAHAPRLLPRRRGISGLVRGHGVPSIAAVAPLHVATWIEARRASSPRRASSSGSPRSAICSTGWSSARSCRPTRPLRCAARSTRHAGQTPVLDPAEARALLDSIDVIDAGRPARPRADRAHGLFASRASARRSA